MRKVHSNYKGKLVNKWCYHHRGLTQEAELLGDEEVVKPKAGWKKVTLGLYLITETEQFTNEPPHATREVKFEIRCDDPKIKFAGTDVALLHKVAWAELDKHFEIKWSSWLLVQVSHETPWQGEGTGMSFFFEDVQKGITYDGKEILRKWGRSDWVIEPWPGRFSTKGGKAIACIEATKENKNALREFQERIDLLREKLQEFLSPDKIEENLRMLAQASMLPALPETTEREE